MNLANIENFVSELGDLFVKDAGLFKDTALTGLDLVTQFTDKNFSGVLADLAKGQADITQVVADIKKEFAPKLGAMKLELGGVKFWRGIYAKLLKRHAVSELANTNLLTTQQAQAMIDAGAVLPGPVPPVVTSRVGAATGAFSNVISWLESNLPALESDFVTLLPLILELITAFSAA